MPITIIQNEGRYLYEGVTYDDIEGVIQSGVLGFCVCGSPWENLNYILTGLELIAENGPDDHTLWSKWYDGHKRRCLDHFGTGPAEYFFYYWTDKEKLTEHGNSIPGWLTDRGKELLEALIFWKQTEEEEE